MKINIKSIVSSIKLLPSGIKEHFKTIYNLPHSGKYFLLSILFFIVFLILTFPYDFLIKKKIYEYEGKTFRSIDIPGFDFSIFGETYIDNLNIVFNNSNELSCKNAILNIALNPVTLFLKNRLKSDFQFDSLKYITKEIEALININGNIDLTLDRQSGLPQQGSVKIILSDSVIKINSLSIPGPMGPMNLKIESINIQSGNLDSKITNGTISLNVFKLSGNDLSCDISGTIELSNITNNSKLNITVNLDSESSIIDQYRDLLGAYIKDNVLTLKIKGTLGRPELALNRADKNEN
ncbi:MAG: type II secretion system protein GspN [Spirochaetae bacterium HGW-Spirochaetae-5]|nr:MAG: type II secretion system protein GspN [Spirochaetae bacterium HGW-Spirochaetae-5]